MPSHPGKPRFGAKNKKTDSEKGQKITSLSGDALRLAAARKGDAPTTKGEPATVSGRKLSPNQLRAFVGMKKGKKERGVAESDNPVAHIKILDLGPLTKLDLENLANLADEGLAIIELNVIGMNPSGQLKAQNHGSSTKKKGNVGMNPTGMPNSKTHGSGMKPRKGKGDVGSSASGKGRVQNHGSQTKPNSKGDVGRNRGGKENTQSTHSSGTSAKRGLGDIATNSQTAVKTSKPAGQTKIQVPGGGTGSNPSGKIRNVSSKKSVTDSEAVANLITGRDSKNVTVEDVERGYPNAERVSGGLGPDLEGKIPGSSKKKKGSRIKLPKEAGNKATGKAKMVKVGSKGNINPKIPMPGKFGLRLDCQEWADGLDNLDGVPTTIEGITVACEAFGVFQGPGSLVAAPKQSTSQDGGGLDILSLQKGMPTQGTDGLGASPTTPAGNANAVDKMMVVVAKSAPAAAKEARSIIKTVLPGFTGISSLTMDDAKLAHDAIEVRVDILGFGSGSNDKLRRGLRAVQTILHTQKSRMRSQAPTALVDHSR